MTEIINPKNINRVITSRFPKLNNHFLLESSVDSIYWDRYYAVNSYKSDNFLEFRIPKTVGVLTDLSDIHLQFELKVEKIASSGSVWQAPAKTTSGDHYDLINASGYSIYKHVSLEFNSVQVQNIDNFSLNNYIKLITNYPKDQIKTIGPLIHIEDYENIIENFPTDKYFNDLKPSSDNAVRLINLRNNGICIRAPLILDINKVNSYLIDGIDITLRLSLHDKQFIFNTAQHNETLLGGKQYTYELNDISLHVKRVKPSNNSYSALNKSLIPKNIGDNPTLNYPFTSQLSKTYYMTQGITQYIVDLPFGSRIPDKLFFVFQTHKAFNTRDYKTNGLYLSHLNIKNIYITINSSTIYNVNCNFDTNNVAEIYSNCLDCLDGRNHLLTFKNFCNGMTLFGFRLAVHDETGNITTPLHGVLRIVLTFKSALSTASVIYMLGDVMSLLSINGNREIFLNKT